MLCKSLLIYVFIEASQVFRTSQKWQVFRPSRYVVTVSLHLRKIFGDHKNKSRSWSTVQGHDFHSVLYFWFCVLALLAVAVRRLEANETWPPFGIADW
jgi:hypothetical protein